MLKFINNKGAVLSASITVGLLASNTAMAGTLAKTSTQGLDNLTENFITSTQNLPGLVSIVAYIAGLALGVLGVLKLKDHVENPTQTPLKDGAVRLGSGGALLALPFLYEVIIGSLAGSEDGLASDIIALEGIQKSRVLN